MKRKKSFDQLSLKKRESIEQGVQSALPIREIARSIEVSPSTVTREIKRNRISQGKKHPAFGPKTDCVHIRECNKERLCRHRCRTVLCKDCGKACNHRDCKDYEPGTCVRITRAPWVCNGCRTIANCSFEKFRYTAKAAQEIADARLHETRQGLDITPRELKCISAVVKEGFEKGQSFYHIKHAYNLSVSVSTLYRYLSLGALLDVRSVDAPKKLRYKLRKKIKEAPHPKEFYKGHEYSDWLKLSKRLRDATWEGDTVLGKRGEKPCILTLLHQGTRFQIHLLMRSKTMDETVHALDYLELLLRDATGDEHAFHKFFPVLLLDRGTEFDDIEGMERSLFDPQEKRTRCYFCDPTRSDQKGACEKNHVEIRKILPKGTSFLALNAHVLAEISSHVNSSIRKSLKASAPYQEALKILPKDFLDALGLRKVAPKDVIQKPNILYKP